MDVIIKVHIRVRDREVDMLDDAKKTNDFFGEFDIDEIQKEIQQEIYKEASKNSDKSQNLHFFQGDSSSINSPTASVYIVPDIKVDTVPVWQPPNTWEANEPSGEQPDIREFYREKIKKTKDTRGFLFDFAKKAMLFVLLFTLGTGTLGFGIGAGFGYFNRVDAPSYALNTEPTTNALVMTSTVYTFDNIVGDGAGSLADIIELIEPSVVSIVSHPPSAELSVVGSGVIFSETEDRIFIVTSNYVVRQMGRVTVSIGGSPPMDAHPAGNDTTIDMAVIFLYKSQLIAAGVDSIVIATFGDSSQMRVGDTVLAIGNAMGEGNSVTRGVLSAIDIEARSQFGHNLNIMQTDAALNHGTSGGPLINTRGEVIGININQMTYGFFGLNHVEGMGYSVPSNVVAPLIDDIINRRRPSLGILGGTVSQDIANRFNVPTIGVFVSSVVDGGSAYRGGMLDHDIITGFNGQPVLNWQQLVYAIRSVQVGDEVEVRLLRYGNTAITIYVVLDPMIVENF